MKTIKLVGMIFLAILVGCAASEFLTGCTLETAGSQFELTEDAGPDAAPEASACQICLGPQYVVNDHIECTGTWIPCETIDAGKPVQ